MLLDSTVLGILGLNFELVLNSAFNTFSIS